ncbi:exonuclease domain-containing protein [Sinomicrobium weinanense]|uniref:GIY-YIG nuclease family protein n=1 Tax=Sinomicrobium weinanense TaxID=2842200 RepID=A0A926Q3P3_9FLAO|nr:exonuclease domain-containing protein [Sinomicrobium weinanense]MBC9797768.1 GIY-YIG nuclease family protein [Sinomicrobium weinanense]MBU3122413.1 GIY-YIG nuclease family protein [Sinomicrobium weinanense]
MYAILDIETTGGQYNEEGITEIAIYKYDGHKVTDRFISLVNPEREIQPFVVNLTGINNNMLRSAPKFYEVAKRIVEITEDCILVAHNAQFDYRILRTEFHRLGFDYKRKTICTVELSQKLIPDAESYSLGKLVRSLGIPVSDRHRAGGDAQATVKLFKLLLAKDQAKDIVKHSIKSENTGTLSPKLLNIVEKLPETVGVYYIHKEDGNIIYIGKSKNIRKRVNQHFTRTSKKARFIQKEVVAVTYEETGNELIALLKENEEIKKNQPRYNRARKRKLFSYGLFQKQNGSGYTELFAEQLNGRPPAAKKPVTTFTSVHEAKNTLYKLTEEFTLCNKLNGLSDSKKHCFNYTIQKCNGACINLEPAETYNKRVEEAVKKYSYPHKNMLIIHKGRATGERSVVMIENNDFKGIAFYDLNYQVNNIDILKKVLTPMKNNADARHIIQMYLRKHNGYKIVEFAP